MKSVKFTKQWYKDLKKVIKYPEYKEKKLNIFIDMLATGDPLPPNAHDHALASNSAFKGIRNFHLAPNLCVLYKLSNDEIILYRIGKHNNLSLTETY